MNTTVIQPTGAVIQAADLINEAVGRYLELATNLQEYHKYESHCDARVLFSLVIRHIEAITELAKRDLVLLPSALVLARATFETTAWILWMLDPEGVFDREARFLAHLASEEKYLHRVADLCARVHSDGKPFREEAETIRRFRTAVEELLPSETKRIPARPSLEAVVKSLGHEQLYGNYRRLSQFTHGTHVAGELYRRNLGCGKVLGEFTSPELWVEPLQCAWWCLASGGSAVMKRLGVRSDAFLDARFVGRLKESLNRIANESVHEDVQLSNRSAEV